MPPFPNILGTKHKAAFVHFDFPIAFTLPHLLMSIGSMALPASSLSGSFTQYRNAPSRRGSVRRQDTLGSAMPVARGDREEGVAGCTVAHQDLADLRARATATTGAPGDRGDVGNAAHIIKQGGADPR